MKRGCIDLLRWLAACVSVGLIAGCGGDGETTTTPTIAQVTLSPATRQVAVGGTALFTAQAKDARGVVIEGVPWAFSTSNSAVAQMIAGGSSEQIAVRGVAQGVATLTATSGGVSGTAVLTVGGNPAAGTPDINVTGSVIDGRTRAGLSGAIIELENGSQVNGGADGSFNFAVPTARPDVITRLVIRKAGYVTTQYRFAPQDLQAAGSPPQATLPPIIMAPDNNLSSLISGAVRNARDNSPIAGAQVLLYGGLGNLTGLSGLRDTTTDSQGGYTFTGLVPATFTVFVIAGGYADCTRGVIAVSGNNQFNQDITCSPASSSEIRVVLTWGTSPGDLDAHLTGPNAGDAGRFHVYYESGRRGSLSGAPFAALDTDKRNGNGPETITITRPSTPPNADLPSGVYRYSVHDFTNRSSATSTALGASGARVELYLPGTNTPRVFTVPNQRGTLWTVFELTGPLANPTVTVRNEMGLASDEAAIQ